MIHKTAILGVVCTLLLIGFSIVTWIPHVLNVHKTKNINVGPELFYPNAMDVPRTNAIPHVPRFSEASTFPQVPHVQQVQYGAQESRDNGMASFPRTIGFRGEPCGRTLAIYRRLGIPGIPLSPEKPPPSNPDNILRMRQMDLVRSFYSADLPDPPSVLRNSHPIGGANKKDPEAATRFHHMRNELVVMLNIPHNALPDCTCEFSEDCKPEIHSRSLVPRYAHQCAGNMACCCSE